MSGIKIIKFILRLTRFGFLWKGGSKEVVKLKSPYHRLNIFKHKDQLDFYDIIDILESNGDRIPHQIIHGIKKLAYNDRGHKNPVQDKKEAVWSINRWIEENESD